MNEEKKPNGSAAFPGSGDWQFLGMSLRDWFAGQALTSLANKYEPEMPIPDIAKEAYDFADAMIAERDK